MPYRVVATNQGGEAVSQLPAINEYSGRSNRELVDHIVEKVELSLDIIKETMELEVLVANASMAVGLLQQLETSFLLYANSIGIDKKKAEDAVYMTGELYRQ